jgi:N-acetylglutamate synthase-like GNAT family acetyltransferase
MTEYTLRPAIAADDPAIRALIQRVEINPFGLDWRRFVLAVAPDGALIGCGQLKPHGDGSVELASIAVEEAHRGEGIARAIIEHLLPRAPRPLYLMCRPVLGDLYRRFGFQPVGEEQLPPYFRRIRRVLRLVGRAAGHDGPLIMRLD